MKSILNTMKKLIFYLILFLLLSGFNHSKPGDDLKAYVFNRLETVKTQKKQQLLELFGRIEKTAKSAKIDPILIAFHHTLNRDKDLLAPDARIPAELRSGIEKYLRSINEYYLNSYLDFYDILFVDKQGFIFYNIRKESDYRTNILTGKLSETRLAECMRTPNEEFFVDFQYYSPAEEPAAFFLNRVCKDGEHQGWIVMQFALNMLNSLLVDYSDLGDTGEVYIVNQDLLMLTDSRFTAERTSLNKRIDTESVRDAFKKGSGSKLITGYRGVKVFTVYESFDLWDSRWAIVASIEEDEIITMHFRNNQKYYTEILLQSLNVEPLVSDQCRAHTGKQIKVDMDEFSRALPGKILTTRGVSSCTAVTICYPGKFGYMAHISPRDKIYGKDNLTHLLKDMVRNIQYYEIHLNEMRDLRFVIIANHLNSLNTILEKLMSYGIHLSQITFLYNSQARYANVSFDCANNSIVATWIYPQGKQGETCQLSASAENMSGLIKRIIKYE